MKENYESLRASRPEVRNGISLVIYRFAGRVFSLLFGVMGVSLLMDGGFGRRVMRALEATADERIGIGVEFLVLAFVCIIFSNLAANSMKRNRYILELEKLIEKDIAVKEKQKTFS